MRVPNHPNTLDNAEAMPAGALLRRLGALAWRHKFAAVPAVAATVVLQAFILAGLAAQGLAIDLIRRIADPDAPAPDWPLGLDPPGGWSTFRVVALLAGVILAFGLLAAIARYAVRVADELFVQICIVDLRTRLYEHLQRLSFRFFDAHDSGQIINRLTADAQSARSFIQGVMLRAGVALVTFTVFLAFMLREHVWLTLACLVVFPVQAAVMTRFARTVKPLFTEQARLIDVLIRVIQESIAGARVVRAFGREPEQIAEFDARAAEARDHRIRIGRGRAVHIPVIQAGSFMSLAVLLGVGGYLVMLGPAQGGIALGTLWVFRGLVERLARQVEAIVWIVGSAPEALAGAERVFRLLEHPVEIDNPAARDEADTAHPVRGKVELRDVSFAYEPGVPVLRGVSLTAEPGQTIAIVGRTGSGKSTLLSLIARFYDPDEGAVLLDDTDLRDLPVDRVRSSIAYVFQDPFLFSNRVDANVAFARPDADADEVRGALAQAAADEFVGELPEGVATVIGERGVSLSGGQRQRLTLARALLTDAPILILDDATGSVDAETEQRIQHALDGARRGRTTFIVAHRLSTLRRADRVVVLDEGRVVDEGTPEELMSREGHYRAAALIQLATAETSEDALA